MIMYIAAAFCGIAVLAIDQFTKYYVSSHFVIGETRKFLNGFIDLTYIHNEGAAWGMLSGGIGNMIDRVFRGGSVVDFLHFEFFPSFPVFNIADCAIVLGAVLLALYFIFDLVKEEKQKKSNGEN